jgi:hypothetical protein
VLPRLRVDHVSSVLRSYLVLLNAVGRNRQTLLVLKPGDMTVVRELTAS